MVHKLLPLAFDFAKTSTSVCVACVSLTLFVFFFLPNLFWLAVCVCAFSLFHWRAVLLPFHHAYRCQFQHSLVSDYARSYYWRSYSYVIWFLKMWNYSLGRWFCRCRTPGPAVMLEADDWFYYFAYGSNLLTERLRLKNPSALKVSAARLDVSLLV